MNQRNTEMFSKFFEYGLTASRQIRFCPPDEIINDPDQAEKVKEHTEKCDICSKRVSAEVSANAWKEIVKKARELTSAVHLERSPEPSEIRFLKDIGWSTLGGRLVYINGPMVALTEEIDENTFRACMLFHDYTLATPNDVKIEYNLDVSFKLLLQPWNSFPILKNDVDVLFGGVDHDTIESLKEIEGKDIPEDIALPRFSSALPLYPNDPRQTFMNESVELSFVYSMRSINKLLVEDCKKQSNPRRPSYLRVVK